MSIIYVTLLYQRPHEEMTDAELIQNARNVEKR